MVDFNNVSFGYDIGSLNVNNVSFHINKGDFTAIIGSNGAGKSTLSKMFNGLIKPSQGKIIVNGIDISTVKTSVLAKSIGFLFQNPDRQLCCNTIEEEIIFGLECVYQDKTLIKSRCDHMLAEFGFDPLAAPFSLSRGERQRVALASLLAVEPEILILDEPTTGLDYKECMHIMNMVKNLNKKGVTVIMVCHDMELVLDFAKRVLVMSGGELIADDTVRNFFTNKVLMEKASIIPPQIAGLSQRLGNKYKDIFTVDEMVAKVKSLVGGNGI